MAQFDPLQNGCPSTNRQEICCRLLRRWRLHLCQVYCKYIHWGLLHKLVFKNLYPFFGNSPTGQTHQQIFTLDVSVDTDSRKGVPFGSLFDIAPHLWSVPPKNILRVSIGIFKPNLINIKTCIISKLLHQFQPDFADTKTTKCSLWVVQMCEQQIQGGGPLPIFEKLKNCYNSVTVWPIAKKCHILILLILPAIKIFNF